MSRKRAIIITAGAVAIALAILAIIIFRNKRMPESFAIEPAYAEYISAITSGLVSSEATIVVAFTRPAYSGNNVPNPAKLLDFSPGIKGEARWLNPSTLEYMPASPLKSGELYNGKLYIGKLFDVPAGLETMEFSFQVIPQDIAVEDDGIHSYPGNDGCYYLTGTVTTADVAQAENVAQCLKANLGGSDINVSYIQNEDRRTGKFRIDSIRRGNETSKLTLNYSGTDIQAQREGKIELEVPPTGEFSILGCRIVNYPSQHLKIIFSDPLETTQNLDGLISLSNGIGLRFTREDNQVLAYPQTSVSDQNITLRIDKGVRNFHGHTLPNDYTRELWFKDIKPSIELAGKGVIIPGSGDAQLPFRCVNLRSVDLRVVKIYENNILQFLQVNNLEGDYQIKRVGRPVVQKRIDLAANPSLDLSKWNLFTIDLSKLIEADPGAIYRVTLSFRKEYSLYKCPGDTTPVQESTFKEENWDYGENYSSSYWDYYDEYYDYDEYWENHENPCHWAYYRKDRSVSRNVLFSDLGIITKASANHTVTALVTSISSAKPISGAVVEIYDYQQQLLGTAKTDGDGMATITCDHKPWFVIARLDDQRNYIIMEDGAALALSTFDVAGEQVQKGLKGFIYGERGVWRPGDTLFLSFIIEDKEKNLPTGHPIGFELINPSGQIVKKIMRSYTQSPILPFTVPTEADAPTGDWQARVTVGQAVFRKQIKIETIKPNRLSIDLRFPDKLVRANTPNNASLNVKWLHGAPAGGLRTNITATLSSSSTNFKGYADYVFDDPARTFSSEQQEIFDGRLDDQGNSTINFSLAANNNAPGFLRANFLTKVFEESGEFSVDFYSTSFSPFDSYVGIKTPKGDASRGMLLTDTTHSVEIVTLDADGKPVSRSGLRASVYKVDWRWWWDRTEENLGNFVGNYGHSPIVSKTIATRNGKGEFHFKINYPDWGRYLIRIEDPAGHAAGRTVYIDWPGWAAKPREGQPGGASLLMLSPDKDKYTVGEKAIITLPGIENGRALVSIESGSRIIDMYWFEPKQTKQNRAQLTIDIKPGMAPNAYINVTYLQPWSGRENELPLRLYGCTPILVDDPATRLEPQITVPEKIESEQLFTIKVKEAKGKPMFYTIAVVDEGLLGITRFKTPDPHATFYAKEALGIRTWDIFDLVFGGAAGKVENVFGIGGDEEALADAAKKTNNRFKPVVTYMGPFELRGGKTNTHSFRMPKYTGAVRTMVVAAREGAYGQVDKTTLVKNSLMVLGTAPRLLSPGDIFQLPVTVFAEDKAVKKVDLTLKTNKLLRVTGPATKSVTFTQPGNQVVYFDVEVMAHTGISEITIAAKGGSFSASYDMSIEVRLPNPPVTRTVGESVEPGKSWETSAPLFGLTGTNSATVEFYTIPPVDLSRRIRYLITYPHGCLEQTTSSVFPQLYLGEFIDLSKEKTAEIEQNIRTGIERIRQFQHAEGGMVYWPVAQSVDEWATNYAGHFMLEAEKQGFVLPPGYRSTWIKFQRRKAQSWPSSFSNQYQDDLTQAYRLYTLALAGEPELGAMNRLRERNDLTLTARWQLAAAYQYAGKDEIARSLIAGIAYDIPEYIETGGTYGSDTRDHALVMRTLCLLGDKNKAANLALKLSKSLSSDKWLSTQSTAYALMAMADFVKLGGKSAREIKCNYQIAGNAGKVNVSKATFELRADVHNLKSLPVKVTNTNNGVLYVRVTTTGVPARGNDTDVSNGLSLSIRYLNAIGDNINPASIKQGTDFRMEISVTNLAPMEVMQNIALTQLVPSGWEIVNTRTGGFQSAFSIDQPDYTDIRDDRIHAYFDLKRGQSKTFVFLCNAAYAGTYWLPATSCSAMYDNRINAYKAGTIVKVVR